MKDSIAIIEQFYKPGTTAYTLVKDHGEAVKEKALAAARKVPHLNPDLEFIASAAMLHDIGIFLTDAPMLGCTGKHPYILHGVLGKELLENLGLKRHAGVCERHVGVGISRQDIIENDLPLPHRDMLPLTIEEVIVCYADKFFSKTPGLLHQEKSMDVILKELSLHGRGKTDIFMEWTQQFGC